MALEILLVVEQGVLSAALDSAAVSALTADKGLLSTVKETFSHPLHSVRGKALGCLKEMLSRARIKLDWVQLFSAGFKKGSKGVGD